MSQGENFQSDRIDEIAEKVVLRTCDRIITIARVKVRTNRSIDNANMI